MRSRSKFMAVGAAITIAGLNLAMIAPAHADIAPGGSDIVGVGSDTVQNIGNFMADGDPFGASTGINSSATKNRFFSFDATPDANDRAGYLENSTTATQLPLTPTIVLRAGTSPVQRPNGSGAGIGALILDPTHKIDFVRMSRLPKTPEQHQAILNGMVGGFRVIKIATDKLAMAEATVTNAPAALTALQLVDIYQCKTTANNWSQFGGAAGTIIPQTPQAGSGTGDTFNADLDIAAGLPTTTAFPFGNCVVKVEENDPTSITGSALAGINTIAPFSEGRLKLYNSGYFFDPAVKFPGAATPLSAGIKLMTGAGSYSNLRNLYIVFRESDTASTTKWQPGSNLNFVQALFLNPGGSTPYVNSADGLGAIASGGATASYANCGAGEGVTTC
jgi:ABC-type phosphate transport system substrate-binding protein